jgi:hypothetical protein
MKRKKSNYQAYTMCFDSNCKGHPCSTHRGSTGSEWGRHRRHLQQPHTVLPHGCRRGQQHHELAVSGGRDKGAGLDTTGGDVDLMLELPLLTRSPTESSGSGLLRHGSHCPGIPDIQAAGVASSSPLRWARSRRRGRAVHCPMRPPPPPCQRLTGDLPCGNGRRNGRVYGESGSGVSTSWIWGEMKFRVWKAHGWLFYSLLRKSWPSISIGRFRFNRS